MSDIRTDYAFDASAQTITFTDPVVFERISLIVDLDNNEIIYNFADPDKGGSLAGLVLTLEFDTSSLNDSDPLAIFYTVDGQTDALTDTQLRASDVPVVDSDLNTAIGLQNDSMASSDIGTFSLIALFKRLLSRFSETFAPKDSRGKQTTTISNSTTETTIVTATSSEYHDIVAIIVTNTSTATDTRIDFRDTTSGTVLFSLESRGGQQPTGFAVPGAAIPQTTANTNWTAQCATATTDIRIFVIYEKRS